MRCKTRLAIGVLTYLLCTPHLLTSIFNHDSHLISTQGPFFNVYAFLLTSQISISCQDVFSSPQPEQTTVLSQAACWPTNHLPFQIGFFSDFRRLKKLSSEIFCSLSRSEFIVSCSPKTSQFAQFLSDFSYISFGVFNSIFACLIFVLSEEFPNFQMRF